MQTVSSFFSLIQCPPALHGPQSSHHIKLNLWYDISLIIPWFLLVVFQHFWSIFFVGTRFHMFLAILNAFLVL